MLLFKKRSRVTTKNYELKKKHLRLLCTNPNAANKKTKRTSIVNDLKQEVTLARAKP